MIVKQLVDYSIKGTSIKAVVKNGGGFWDPTPVTHWLFILTSGEKDINHEKAFKEVFDAGKDNWKRNKKGTGFFFPLKRQKGIVFFHQVNHEYEIPAPVTAQRRIEREARKKERLEKKALKEAEKAARIAKRKPKAIPPVQTELPDTGDPIITTEPIESLKEENTL